jgi:hypothetical protein
MRHLLTAVLLGAATLTAGACALAHPPALVAQAPPPPAGVQKDGPFRLLVRARKHAHFRRVQGFRAEVISENGFWWVVYYH